jgi:uncharacterized protein (DUF1697 family)
MTYVAFIRGINVGRHKRVSMADVRNAFAAAGAKDASTYLQSGNVVFTSSEKRERLGPRLEKELKRGLGIDVSVVVRSATELKRIVARNPFPEERDDRRLHVAFLDRAAPRRHVGRLDGDRVAPDEFQVRARDVYLHYPNGYGHSKLTNDYLEKQLGVRSTMRNWRTVTALAEKASAAA